MCVVLDHRTLLNGLGPAAYRKMGSIPVELLNLATIAISGLLTNHPNNKKPLNSGDQEDFLSLDWIRLLAPSVRYLKDEFRAVLVIMILKDSFDIKQAGRITGISTRMLDYLCRTELAIPSKSRGKRGRGKTRKFSYSDLIYLRSLQILLDRGVSVKRMKSALAQLRKECFDTANIHDISNIHLLVTDGKNVYRIAKKENIENLTQAGQYEFLFIIDHVYVKSTIDAAIRDGYFHKPHSARNLRNRSVATS